MTYAWRDHGANESDHRLISAHLELLQAHGAFGKSPKSFRLLQYLVEEELAGRGTGLKEYGIGLAVFGRGEDFDPRVDTVVRVGINRLRVRLQSVYGDTGDEFQVRIRIPAGSYRPQVEIREGVEELPPAEATVPGGATERHAWGRAWWLIALATVLVVGVAMWRPAGYRWQSETAGPADLEPFRTFPALSEDGKWMAYSAVEKGELQIWREEVATGIREKLTDGPCPKVTPAFSPDGAWITYRADCNSGGVYVRPANGAGGERLVAAYGREPSFSPDGKRLTYVIINPRTRFGKVYVARLDEPAEPVAIAREFDDAHAPVWTPDGEHILLCGTRRTQSAPENGHDVYVVPAPRGSSIPGDAAVKTGLMERLKSEGLNTHPDILQARRYSWAGADLLFATGTREELQGWRIRFSNGSTPSLNRLTPQRTGENIAHLSIGGGNLAYSSIRYGRNVWEIPLRHSARAASGEVEQLVGETSLSPAASRNGERIAYLVPEHNGAVKGGFRIHVLDRQTGIVRKMPRSAMGLTRRMAISGDGKLVVFRVIEPSDGLERQAIYGYYVDEDRVERICADCGAPTDVTDDGKHVIYESPNTVNRLAVVKIGSGEKVEILEHPDRAVLQGKTSPRGNWIAFSVDHGPDGQWIYAAPFAGDRPTGPEHWRVVAQGRHRNEFPQWTPDGRGLYFLSDRDGARCVWVQEVDPMSLRAVGEPREVYSFHGFQLNPFRLSTVPTHLIGFSVHERGAVLSLQRTRSQVAIESWKPVKR